MSSVLILLACIGVVGAFDTLYYHEWKARLPVLPGAQIELKIHAVRDFFYALLFTTLPWLVWQGTWAFVLLGVLFLEIGLTLADFIIERNVRKPLGDVYTGERVTHATIGILYGAMMANLVPRLIDWSHQPTQLLLYPAHVPASLRWVLTCMGFGVFLSGCRDLYAAFRLPGYTFPYKETTSCGTSDTTASPSS